MLFKAQFSSWSDDKKIVVSTHKKTQAKCKYRVVTQFSSDVLKNNNIFTQVMIYCSDYT